MLTRDIVVIGASAGGVETVLGLVEDLPSDLPASIFIVVHAGPASPGMLAKVLARRSRLPVSQAEDGEAIRREHIYVARPNYHLVFEGDRMCLTSGPQHNRHRPAIDVLFRSAAETFGPRVVGVVLTGLLDDGSAGLAAIQSRGGYTIVQDPEDALVPSMPQNALRRLRPDRCVAVSGLAHLLDIVCREPVEVGGGERMHDPEAKHTTAPFVCPDCGGVLQELTDGSGVQFACHVGHTFSPEGALAAQDEDTEQLLWSAVRALEESAAARRRLQELAHRNGWHVLEERYRLAADEREQHGKRLRAMVERTLDEHGAADDAA